VLLKHISTIGNLSPGGVRAMNSAPLLHMSICALASNSSYAYNSDAILILKIFFVILTYAYIWGKIIIINILNKIYQIINHIEFIINTQEIFIYSFLSIYLKFINYFNEIIINLNLCLKIKDRSGNFCLSLYAYKSNFFILFQIFFYQFKKIYIFLFIIFLYLFYNFFFILIILFFFIL
jgi:hypothetical protein